MAVVEKKLAPEVVKRELAIAAAELERAQKRSPADAGALDDGQRRAIALLAEAAAIDRQLTPALIEEKPATSDDVNLRRLKKKLTEQQRATAPLMAATQMAFRTRTVVEQLERALPRLESRLKR